MKNIYRGYSTRFYKSGNFYLSDIELVNNDLLNHILTAKGEVPHDPNFGTRIPTLAFENITDATKSIITEDINSVVSNDPRVQLKDIAILMLPNNNAIVIVVDLYYIQLDVDFSLQIDL